MRVRTTQKFTETGANADGPRIAQSQNSGPEIAFSLPGYEYALLYAVGSYPSSAIFDFLRLYLEYLEYHLVLLGVI